MELNTSLVARQYAANRTATTPQPGEETGGALSGLVQNFASTLQESEATAMETMTTGSDPHALVQALAQTELAVETAVTIRNKVVEAYQEILRMPV
ncbi:flagellar hook-basal body complex protein FliE [Flavimaricola marinus]|uniref:Flagellar hook-basal body protein FliE n=1 Tax=Flavimaricola marinus TaxID=1819565 RepID=A0A238LFN8_9RHOB|nr:flagellar hook-basal body complex protein FliE [Flavimaricola marinus]SMY08235.1 flagellar hook-basal body protein FliE [Flavimaricola marinus]